MPADFPEAEYCRATQAAEVTQAGSGGPIAPRALASLLEHRDRFLGFLTARLGSPDLADELLQDAMAKAIERGGQLRDEETAVAWFYRLLRNSVTDYRRRLASSTKAIERWSEESETTTPAI